MDYLSRNSAPFDEELWNQIDSAVVSTAKKTLVGRRFLSLFGPLGSGAQNVLVDSGRKEEDEDGLVKSTGRIYQELPQLHEDFKLYWRDLENTDKNGYPLSLSPVYAAAQALSFKEDKLIFFGSKFLSVKGLLNAGGQKLARKDWSTGENAYIDVAEAIAMLAQKGVYGRYALCLSPDLYAGLQRLQPGTGVTELERIEKLVDGKVYRCTVLDKQKAVLVCAEPQFMDLAVGQDMAVAYLELVDLNHSLRILETSVPRIKNPQAIVVLE